MELDYLSIVVYEVGCAYYNKGNIHLKVIKGLLYTYKDFSKSWDRKWERHKNV